MTSLGWPRNSIARVLGEPNSTTAATWLAKLGSSGLGIVAGSTSCGTESGTADDVTKPATAAPCE